MDELRLGSLLLEGGIVDEAGLERCLAIQTLTGNTRPIGRILIEQGLMDEPTLTRLLDLQKHRVQETRAKVPDQDLTSTSLLTAARANGASELVVSEGRSARIRVGPVWRQLSDQVLSGPEVWDFLRETMGASVLETLAEQRFVAQPWRSEGIGYGSAFAFRQCEGVAVRLTFSPETAPTPAALGVPQVVLDTIAHGKGLVLVVGERGIGRAAVLASLVHAAAADKSRYVVLVDDEPCELPTTGAMVVQRRFGHAAAQQAAALRSVVREDPDALIVGDVGNLEAFDTALRAAEGGRLVIGYVDAATTVSALTRVLNLYPVYELPRVRATLAAVLRVVFVRHLLPDLEHTGNVPVTELVVVDDVVREVVRRGELTDISLLLRDEKRGTGHSLDRCMLDLLTAGVVRMEDVFARAEEKAWLLERTRNLETAAR